MSEGPLLTENNLARQLQLNEGQASILISKRPPLDTYNLTDRLPDEESTSLFDNYAEVRSLAAVEKAAIEHAIAACSDNIVKAASLLRVSPSTLYRKIQQWQE
jgi:two-component system repressor protein LuxO